MAEVGVFFKNLEFHDATLLLGSDGVLLQQSHVALQDTFRSAKLTPEARARAASRLARWQYCMQIYVWFQRNAGMRSASFFAVESAASFAGPAAACLVKQIPAHRIVLSSGSDYFKTAMSTLIGQDAVHCDHPIIVLHEEDIDAAQGVLQFLYTKVLDSMFNKIPQLMTLLLVSG